MSRSFKKINDGLSSQTKTEGLGDVLGKSLLAIDGCNDEMILGV
jgi:hypothetical protein